MTATRALVATSMLVGMALAATPAAAVGPETPVGADRPAREIGAFGTPFAEPTVDGQATQEKCVPRPDGSDGRPGGLDCKPTAGSLAILPDGHVLYWDAFEGTESVKVFTEAEYGRYAARDQSRILDLGASGPSWSVPSPADGGSHDATDDDPFPLFPETTYAWNSGSLFCSDLAFLPDGRVLAAGGSRYADYSTGVSGEPRGMDFEGIRATRIFDPRTGTWLRTGDMHYDRWYPSVVELADGRILVASGVKHLLDNYYGKHPESSAANVRQVETYDPGTGQWTDNGPAAEHSLPLYPRLHLLPDGHVLYSAAGQAFNPMGYAWDEVTWNDAASYDPGSRTWTVLGLAGAGTTLPGFRGSTFSIMLPLTADADGRYTAARFLEAGGTGVVTPGDYVPTTESAITTVETRGGERMSSRETGPLRTGRWFSTAVLLPSGQVLALSGADRDANVSPGLEFGLRQAEMFDPQTQRWSPVAVAHNARTYHNTAALLPDGSVLVGGHAPAPFMYTHDSTAPGGFAPNDGRDPSFEIYQPPYMFAPSRPRIDRAPDHIAYGGTFGVTTSLPAGRVDSVVLVRNTAITHTIDADQRSVVLRVLSRDGNHLTLAEPPDGNVAPPGPYMLFVNRRTQRGLVPSVAAEVAVGRADPAGEATLVGPPAALSGRGVAGVRGRSIDRVTFSVDGGHRVVLVAGTRRRLSVVIDARRLAAGRHRLVARVRFLPGSRTAPVTLRRTFVTTARRRP